MSEEHKRKIGKANKGKKPSRKTIEASVKARKESGFIPSNIFKKGSIPWNKGLKTGPSWNSGKKCPQISKALIGHNVSERTKEKMRLAKMGKRGEDTSNWQGGKTKLKERERKYIEVKLWRKAVFERDNYTCQCCGSLGGDLNAHHILNFSEHKNLRTAIDNGITLCEECHHNFHNRYGFTNNTKEQLDKFIGGNE